MKRMKRIMVHCPNCHKVTIYRNWFIWILRTPFHWFGKRRSKCPHCGHKAYVKGVWMWT